MESTFKDMKRTLVLAALVGWCVGVWPCTNLIVGKKASADGSVMITYNADDFGAYGWVHFYPAGHHKKGEMHACYHYETNNYLGEVPEVEYTYGVVGQMNDQQLSIMETTYGGREELCDTTGMLDYGSLMYLTLQRAKTAREAIDVWVDLANTYGYQSEGESITFADPNEAWIMDMIGKGPGVKGILWVAQRVPDDCISGHANQARTTTFPLKDPENCVYAKDVIEFAREKGYFSGKDKEFSFREAYAPLDFGGRRICDARVWSFFNRHCEGMDVCLPYVMGKEAYDVELPLWVRPDRKVSVNDLKQAMRDHYDGTPMDMTQDAGMGPYEAPYRPTPLYYEVDGKQYFNERPIGTQQTGVAYLAQLRSWLPNHIGGVMWVGCDDANMVAYTPLYCCSKMMPECFREHTADAFSFSMKSAYWLCNMTANFIYPRYSQLFPELKAVRDGLDGDFESLMGKTDAEALAMSEAEAVDYLTAYTQRAAGMMMSKWKALLERVVVKYNDGVVKPEKDGQYLRTAGGEHVPTVRPGYPERYKRMVVEQTGEKFAKP